MGSHLLSFVLRLLLLRNIYHTQWTHDFGSISCECAHAVDWVHKLFCIIGCPPSMETRKKKKRNFLTALCCCRREMWDEILKMLISFWWFDVCCANRKAKKGDDKKKLASNHQLWMCSDCAVLPCEGRFEFDCSPLKKLKIICTSNAERSVFNKVKLDLNAQLSRYTRSSQMQTWTRLEENLSIKLIAKQTSVTTVFHFQPFIAKR